MLSHDLHISVRNANTDADEVLGIISSNCRCLQPTYLQMIQSRKHYKISGENEILLWHNSSDLFHIFIMKWDECLLRTYYFSPLITERVEMTVSVTFCNSYLA